MQGSAEPKILERDAAWFHELDAWTEYWDVYHPETRGRFYFGDGDAEPGLLTRFLPREQRPLAFRRWTQLALLAGSASAFSLAVREPEVATAVLEVDALVARLFEKHFGDAADPLVQSAYLDAMFRCATDSLPAAVERDARIAEADWRKPTAGRHVIDNDLMWFAWALHLEATNLLAGREGRQRRTLQLAGVAAACSLNFAWRGHRRTRAEYGRNQATITTLRERGLRWATDFESGAHEVHALFRIREWGSDPVAGPAE